MIAFHYFQAIGRIPKECGKYEWCLHHVDTELKNTDIQQYNEWRVEDLEPMLTSEHIKLHQNLRSPMPEKTRRKIANTLMGHGVSEDTRKKISEKCKGLHNGREFKKGEAPWNKGRKATAEERRRNSEAQKGLVWANNGIISTRVKESEIPEGFVRGRLKRK